MMHIIWSVGRIRAMRMERVRKNRFHVFNNHYNFATQSI